MNAPATSQSLFNPKTRSSHPKAYASEIRFGVVLYGGASLAIYINGVVREMFEMVRATPKDGLPGKKADGITEVYRRLAWLADNPDLVEQYAELIRQRNLGQNQDSAQDVWDEGLTVGFLPSRLVVDVISGTSAGGINGIFLAKALANGSDFSKLQDLWVKEGDISLLLNDKHSYENLDIIDRKKKIDSVKSAPQSLLNSERMYLKLADVMKEMSPELGKNATRPEPLVDEVDLYVTTTDIAGSPVPLRLSGKLVEERRHKQNFHFSFSADHDRNDFSADNNALLAFAARCTSAFPFAFEPMTMNAVKKVDPQGFEAIKGKWHRHLSYLPKDEIQSDQQFAHAFGDGGYLDNKPFTYVTKTLATRQAIIPVERKLVYVEPAPERISPDTPHSPDALENSLAALSGIPRYETIREDLQEMLRRNHNIERVDRIIREGEADLHTMLKGPNNPYIRILKEAKSRGNDTVPPWPKFKRADMAKLYGTAFLAYRRMRVSSATEDLAFALARLWKIDFHSDHLYALTALLREWRKQHYQEESSQKASINLFLARFDLDFRIRRLSFLLKQIDQLTRLLRARLNALTKENMPPGQDNRPEAERRVTSDQDRHLTGRLMDEKIFLAGPNANRDRIRNTLAVLTTLKGQLDQAYKKLRTEERWRREAVSMPSFIDYARQKDLESLMRLMDAPRRAELQQMLDMVLGKKENEAVELSTVFSKKVKVRLTRQTIQACASARTMQDSVLRRTSELIRHSVNRDEILLYDALMKSIDLMSLEPRFSMQTQDSNTVSGTYEILGKPTLQLVTDTEEDDVAVRIHDVREGILNSDEGQAIRRILGEYYVYFDLFDQMSFPLYQDANIGEPATVEIVRISPEDATSLIDERKDPRRKLAGTALGHFGAFMDRKWRCNDIMWGRLDGAERLVQILLPSPGDDAELVRGELIGLANRTILSETLMPEEEGQLTDQLFKALEAVPAGQETNGMDFLLKRAIPGKAAEPGQLEQFTKRLASLMDGRSLVEYVHNRRDLDRALDPKQTFVSASRAATITGRMLSDINQKHGKQSAVIRWVLRTAVFMQHLISFSLPGTIKAYWSRHLLTAFYAAGLLLAGFAYLLGAGNSVWVFILKFMGAVLVLNLLLFALTRIARGETHWGTRLQIAGKTAVLLLALTGVLALADGYLPSQSTVASAKTTAQSARDMLVSFKDWSAKRLESWKTARGE